MNKKITRWSLMNILFAILVSIPLWSIVVRTGYVLLNKNAYQSYYGETINEKIDTNVSIDNLQVGKDYELLVDAPFNDMTNIRFSIYATNNKFIYNGIEYEATNMTFYIDNGTTPYMMLYINNSYTNYINLKTTSLRVSFNFASINLATDGNNIIKNDFYLITYNSYSYLDNVFDYSIDKFNSENDAHFDFVSNIANIFITEESYGWRYVEFVNWYFNYFIVISACYILFLAIIWFIAVIRRVIERSMHII